MCHHSHSTVSYRRNKQKKEKKNFLKERKRRGKSSAPDITLHCCSCCITQRGYDFTQCFSIWRPVHQEISWAERQFYTSQIVYFTSFYLTFILCCSFCAENIHKKPVCLVWLGNSPEDSEREKKERGLFLTKAISQRSPHTRWRNLWLWLKVKRHTMMKISSFDFHITPVWQKYLCRFLKGGLLYWEKNILLYFFRSSTEHPALDLSEQV